jgi:hypothetical protein
VPRPLRFFEFTISKINNRIKAKKNKKIKNNGMGGSINISVNHATQKIILHKKDVGLHGVPVVNVHHQLYLT